MAGRDTPLMRPMRRSALAMVAPVLPALTIADARPSRTASAARTSEESFMVRTLDAASASMAMTSDASMSSRPWVSPMASARPTRTMGMPSSSAAWAAPATISPGALSPPMASTALGRVLTGRAGDSVDVDRLEAVVPAAVATHHVRTLHRAATGAGAARRRGDLPGRGPAAAALGLGGLLLGDGHRCSSVWWGAVVTREAPVGANEPRARRLRG